MKIVGIAILLLLIGTFIAPSSMATWSGSGIALAQDAVVTRDLPATAVIQGNTFDVTITFSAPDNNFNAIGLTDIAGGSYMTVVVNSAWCDPDAIMANKVGNNGAQYIWFGPYNAGQLFTAMYQVTVGPSTPPGTYPFTGTLEYYIGGTHHIVPISGDMQVQVGLTSTSTPAPTPTPTPISGGGGGGGVASTSTPTPTITPRVTPTPTPLPTVTPGPTPTVTPIPSPTPTPAQFSLRNLTVNPSAVTSGENVTISVDVLNTGDVQGSYTAELKINGSIEETKETTLAGGAGATVVFTVTKDTPGNYTIEIGEQTGEFTVSAHASALNWTSIGGGIAAAVVVVGIVAASLLKRRKGASAI